VEQSDLGDMSVKFNWSSVNNQELRDQIRGKINEAIERELKMDDNFVVQLDSLDLGTEPPELQIAKISELKTSKAHLTFAFSYHGNASMHFKINLQVNPLVSHRGMVGHIGRAHMGCLAAHLPLRAEIYTVLSKFHLEGTLDLSFTGSDSEDECSTVTSRKSSEGSLVETEGTWQFEDVTKPKRPQGPKVTLTLLNEAFRHVTVNSSYDGSAASLVVANTIRKQIRNGVQKLVGVPISFPLPSPSVGSTSPTPSHLPTTTPSATTSESTPGLSTLCVTPASTPT